MHTDGRGCPSGVISVIDRIFDLYSPYLRSSPPHFSQARKLLSTYICIPGEPLKIRSGLRGFIFSHIPVFTILAGSTTRCEGQPLHPSEASDRIGDIACRSGHIIDFGTQARRATHYLSAQLVVNATVYNGSPNTALVANPCQCARQWY